MNNTDNINVHLSIDLAIQNDQLFPLFSFLSSIESKCQSDQTPAPVPSPKRKKMTEEEKKARRKEWEEANRDKEKARKRAWYETHRAEHLARTNAYHAAHRDRHNAQMRLNNDKRAHSHIEGYVPTSDYKKDFRISDFTSDGYLYLAFDQATRAYKIGQTRCTPETRLANYQSKDSDTITFLQQSSLLEDIDEAEDIAHQMLRGHVTFVKTSDKTTPSSNPCAEWMQLDGDYDLEDVKAIFDGICELYEKDTEKEETSR